MKILTIVGARPQFVKASALSEALNEAGADEILVHTGQHYDDNMSKVFFDELGIRPAKYHLGIGGGSHAEMTGQQMIAVEKLMQQESPDWVIVFGDTNSTLAGAITAAKLHIPVAHVEAGLRSFNRRMPEEINRILTDHCSSKLFCPSHASVNQLQTEGVDPSMIHMVGDIMLDVYHAQRSKSKEPAGLPAHLITSAFHLCTVHRAENTEEPSGLSRIFAAFDEIDEDVVLPCHPRTRQKLAEWSLKVPACVHLIDPTSFHEMIWLEENCKLVLTDSGGVQKEAYFCGKPCITLREQTEWIELVEGGYNRLVGTDREKIVDAMKSPPKMADNLPIYGMGDAAKRITRVILGQ